MRKPNDIQLKSDRKLALHFQNARRVCTDEPRNDCFSCQVGRKNIYKTLLLIFLTIKTKVHLTAKAVITGIFIFCTLFFASCGEKIDPEEERARQEYSELMNSFRFPYMLDNPTQVYKMPEVLREISGLGITKTGEVGCIQDEQGVIFIYDTDQCEINRRIGWQKC